MFIGQAPHGFFFPCCKLHAFVEVAFAFAFALHGLPSPPPPECLLASRPAPSRAQHNEERDSRSSPPTTHAQTHIASQQPANRPTTTSHNDLPARPRRHAVSPFLSCVPACDGERAARHWSEARAPDGHGPTRLYVLAPTLTPPPKHTNAASPPPRPPGGPSPPSPRARTTPTSTPTSRRRGSWTRGPTPSWCVRGGRWMRQGGRVTGQSVSRSVVRQGGNRPIAHGLPTRPVHPTPNPRPSCPSPSRCAPPSRPTRGSRTATSGPSRTSARPWCASGSEVKNEAVGKGRPSIHLGAQVLEACKSCPPAWRRHAREKEGREGHIEEDRH